MGDPYPFQNDASVVADTFTIESWGGSGIVVPGYGFLLNNELTDFDFSGPHPNVPEAGKRPRSSMALKNGKPAFTIGSSDGSAIITTVLQHDRRPRRPRHADGAGAGKPGPHVGSNTGRNRRGQCAGISPGRQRQRHQ